MLSFQLLCFSLSTSLSCPKCKKQKKKNTKKNKDIWNLFTDENRTYIWPAISENVLKAKLAEVCIVQGHKY